MDLNDWLSAAEARCERAKPGPWVFDRENTGREYDAGYGLYSEPDPESLLARPTVAHVRFGCEAEAEFIAAARSDLPRALSLLRKALEFIEVMRCRCRHTCKITRLSPCPACALAAFDAAAKDEGGR